jgi:hypothetical protein
MNKHVDKSQENKSHTAASSLPKLKSSGEATFQLVDNRPEAIVQQKIHESLNNSQHVQQLGAAQETANNDLGVTQLKADNPIPADFTSQEVIQKKGNNTGLPDSLKSGIETLSGLSMDDVKVHYNSDKPAQLQAHAYAQGTTIHLAAGQEKHLPHEAWHVVQQKQGRVKPTIQLKGNLKVNDDAGLEKEADIMGNNAMLPHLAITPLVVSKTPDTTVQRVRMPTTIKGTTHLVQAVHGSIFNGVQGRLLAHGTIVEVETSDKIRSRLGPNQESFRHYDAQNAPEYRWVRVISVNNIPEAANTYVRDDTFVGGATIPRGSVFTPAIDHRGRTQAGLPDRVFTPIHAPQWYERDLGYDKSSTAERKHAKLLSVAFNSPLHRLGPAMIASARDRDTAAVLVTVGSHLTHVTPWVPSNVESHGKDRHEGLKKPGEYFRTSPAHPLHQEFEDHQQLLGIYKKGVTNEPVNPGWADIATTVMGVKKMKDVERQGPLGIRVRESQNPERTARGPGAVIGHEEMARETAIMKAALLANLNLGSNPAEKTEKLKAGLDSINREERYLGEMLAKTKASIDGYSEARKVLGKQIGVATGVVKAEAAAALKAAESAAKADDDVAPKPKVETQADRDLQVLIARKKQMTEAEEHDGERVMKVTMELRQLAEAKARLTDELAVHLKYSGNPVSGLGDARLQASRTTNLRPLTAVRPPAHRASETNFASSLIENRRHVKLEHLFGTPKVRDITDRSGREHPNLVLHNPAWKKEDAGVKEIHERWKTSGLKTNLQERGSFGHHRPSISPLANNMIRVNPGLYPMSLLQWGLAHALGAEKLPPINPKMDFIHREALNVGVHHALTVIAADRRSRSPKMDRIKEFAKHNLMINLLKAQTILKAPIPNPREHRAYLAWLEKDFSKTAQVLENLNESTHLLLSARVNEEGIHGVAEEPLLLQNGPFRQFVQHTFATGGKKYRIYYVASGMQAITTGAIAAVAFKRGRNEARPAGFVGLHPYFEMRDSTAAAAGFNAKLPAETIIADLSPLDTTVGPEAQSKRAIALGLHTAVEADKTLVPVLDATTTPLGEVPAMVPHGAANYIVVESLTKYAQLGSDKALGGRIIVVGSQDFINATAAIITPVEQNADIVISRIWFESMENVRHSQLKR